MWASRLCDSAAQAWFGRSENPKPVTRSPAVQKSGALQGPMSFRPVAILVRSLDRAYCFDIHNRRALAIGAAAWVTFSEDKSTIRLRPASTALLCAPEHH